MFRWFLSARRARRSCVGPRRHAPSANPGMQRAAPCPVLFLSVFILAAGAPPALAQNAPNDPATLEKQLDDLVRQNAELQRQINELRQRLDSLPQQPPGAPPRPAAPPAPPAATPVPPPAPGPPSPQAALDAAVAEAQAPAQPSAPTGQPSKDLFSLRAGSATLRLIDVSLVVDVAAGWSTENDRSLQTLQGGDHDPRRRGFTLQAAELALTGAVDPYFTAFANINYAIDPLAGDSKVELEEAYATTQSLPWGLQVKGGHYLTEFGLINPTHAHAWDWLDQPVVSTRFFGSDGMRAPGARLAWLTPLPWYSQFIVGVQDSNGETMASFLANGTLFAERPIGGRPFTDRGVSGLGDLAYSARWENSFDLSRDTTVKFGVSGAFGPNPTGPDGQTRIYGADLKLKWRPATSERGWPFVIWQSEVMARDYTADRFFDNSDPANVIDLPGVTLHDWGFYTQLLYGFTPGWAAGLRYEYASGSGDSVGGRDSDPFRDDRQRISPLLVWQLSEFSRLRLQYNHDIADHLKGGHADSVWIGMEILFGAHPAHTY